MTTERYFMKNPGPIRRPFGYRYRGGVKGATESGKQYGISLHCDKKPTEAEWLKLERELREYAALQDARTAS